MLFSPSCQKLKSCSQGSKALNLCRLGLHFGSFQLGSQPTVACPLAPSQGAFSHRRQLHFFAANPQTHAPSHRSARLGPWASVGSGGCLEKLRKGGGEDPLADRICSCQGVANKHQIYVHFERSPFTIGFLSGAVARERRAGQARAPGAARGGGGGLVAVTWGEEHALCARTRAHARRRRVGAPPPRSGSGRPGAALGGAAAGGSPAAPGALLLPPRGTSAPAPQAPALRRAVGAARARARDE